VKRLLLLISILALVLVLTGCMGNIVENVLKGLETDYTIKVSSNLTGLNLTGLNFTGEYSVVTADYDSETGNVDFSYDKYTVEGQIPPGGYIEYTASDAIAVAGWFQKLTAANATLIRIEIWSGGDFLTWQETTDPWGVASAGAIGSESD
jgi:hypothetical protein